jgi:hypothetical protein
MLEILVVIGIMGLLAGVLVVGSTRLLDSKNPSPDDVFWKAVQATRQRALLSGEEVRLRFVGSEKERAFVATGKSGEEKFPCGLNGDLKIEFLSPQKDGSAILIMSQKVETSTVPFVTFYGDGTCSPFKLQIRNGGSARVIAIDPWTCAQVLPKENDRS